MIITSGINIISDLITVNDNDEYCKTISLIELHNRVNEAIAKYGCYSKLCVDPTSTNTKEMMIVTPYQSMYETEENTNSVTTVNSNET